MGVVVATARVVAGAVLVASSAGAQAPPAAAGPSSAPAPSAPPPAGPPPHGPAATGPAPAPSASSAPTDEPRRGLVLIERDGHPLALGAVLSGDGRIVTSLSALGGAIDTDVRYIDGSTQKARVGHRDAGWDLALLVPSTGRWKEGYQASQADPAATEMKTFVPARPRAALVPVHLKGRGDARGRGGEPLAAAIQLDVRAPQTLVGSPVLDGAGRVIALLVHACRGADASSCVPTVIGAPVSALRSFLLRTPADAIPPAPFLGIAGVAEPTGAVRGVRVEAVAPGSPADKSQLAPAKDVIVAVDAHPVDTPEHLSEQIARHAVGDTVKLLVFGEGRFREVAVVLTAAPTP